MAPPRNRRRKVGSMRIDAALDAMRSMGFKDSDVRKRVKNLLEVYGDEGWFFIEEGSYKLLIEKLLDGDGDPGPSAENLISNEAGRDDGASASGEQPESLLMLCDKQDSENQNNVKSGFLTQVDDKHKTQENDSKGDAVKSQPAQLLDFVLVPSTTDSVSTKKIRKPCYGWISANDEDSDDYEFIYLLPANADDDFTLNSTSSGGGGD